MSALTAAITSHNHSAIAAVLAADPASASEPVGGWLPIQWAEKSGHLVTFVRTARLIGHAVDQPLAIERLRQYVALVASTEYEPVPQWRVAAMVWESVFDGVEHKIDRWKRPLLATPEHALDIRYLLSEAGVSSPEQLATLLKNA